MVADGRALFPVHGHVAGVQAGAQGRQVQSAASAVPRGAPGGARAQQRTFHLGHRVPVRVPRPLQRLPAVVL